MLFHQPLRRILFSILQIKKSLHAKARLCICGHTPVKRHSKDLEPRLPDSKTRLGFHYTERKETAILGSVSGQPTASRMGVSENI
jgi:hypothetical protein